MCSGIELGYGLLLGAAAVFVVALAIVIVVGALRSKSDE